MRLRSIDTDSNRKCFDLIHDSHIFFLDTIMMIIDTTHCPRPVLAVPPDGLSLLSLPNNLTPSPPQRHMAPVSTNPTHRPPKTRAIAR